MKKILSVFLALIMSMSLITMVYADDGSGRKDVPEHEHQLMKMANAACHYQECVICFDLFNVGSHTFKDGECTVCGHDDPSPEKDNHRHELISMANMNCHYKECTICYELFEVGSHTFKDGECTVCGHDEPVNPFTDVKETSWYYADVVSAVDMKLVSGKTATLFKPDDNLTYAEALKLAACMNQYRAEGKVTLANGSPWYQSYYEYCVEKGIVSANEKIAFNEKATRIGYMKIFAKALPDDRLGTINFVEDNAIPDVKMGSDGAEAVYKLYRAGILAGVDSAHRCNPSANIKRSEVAAIITRMMDQEERVRFSLGTYSGEYVNIGTIDVTGAEAAPAVEVSYTDSGYYTVDIAGLFIEQNPVSVETSGYSASGFLEVKANGGKRPYTYQWKYRSKEGTFELTDNWNTSGSQTDRLRISANPNDPNTGLSVYCTVTDADGVSVNSAAAAVYGPFIMKAESCSILGSQKYLLTGRLQDGLLKRGQKLSIERNSKIIAFGTVEDIQMFHKSLDQAVKNESIGLVFKVTDGYTPHDGDTLFRYQDYHEIDGSDIIN